MPQSYRWELKRNLERAIKHINDAELQIASVAQNYKEKYPEIYQGYCDTIKTLEDIKDILEKAKILI